MEAVQGTRSLTVVNFRPDYHAAWMSKSYYRQIALTPLGPEATEAMLAELLGLDRALAQVAELIRERTSGNPFFIEEVLQSPVEAGEPPPTTRRLPAHPANRGRGGADDRAGSPFGTRRRLPAREKAVLQAAAVIGKQLSEPLLADVLDLDWGRSPRRCGVS